MALGRPKIEHVQGVPGAERELHVEAPEVRSEVAVLVLGVDHEHLNAAAERPQCERRKQIRLARARMPEHADVGVRVARLVEGVERHGAAARAAPAEHDAVRLLELGVEPRKEGRERARVEHAAAAEPVDTYRQRCEMAVEHAEGARLQPAQHSRRGGKNALACSVELRCGGASHRQIHGDVKRPLLACREPLLQVLGRRQGAGEHGIGSRGVALQPRCAHGDELALQVVDDPAGGQRYRVPGQRQVESRRHEAM